MKQREFVMIAAVCLLCGCPEKSGKTEKERGIGMNLYRAYCGEAGNPTAGLPSFFVVLTARDWKGSTILRPSS